jgi:hypothetical protein
VHRWFFISILEVGEMHRHLKSAWMARECWVTWHFFLRDHTCDLFLSHPGW